MKCMNSSMIRIPCFCVLPFLSYTDTTAYQLSWHPSLFCYNRRPRSTTSPTQPHPRFALLADANRASFRRFRRSTGMGLRRSLEVFRLGTVNYLDALKLQEKLVANRKANKIPDTLLSLQHPPTYTLGKRKTDHNLLIPESEVRLIGAQLHYTERGGDITFHGPRQAILYPIISLREAGLGARKYVEKLETAMIELACQYGVKAQPGGKCETGVWVGNGKIGAIGVRISSGITSHGLAFNIDPDLNYFKHIVPCGIKNKDKGVTSLRKETETDVLLPKDEVVQDQLISCFAKSLGFDDLIFKDEDTLLES